MGEWWTDHRQDQALREMEDQVASLSSSLWQQRSEASQLRSQLGKLHGSLEERINRMARAFDAFVELSDLRVTLSLFDPRALVRHGAREIIARIEAPRVADPLSLPDDVPGYWLGPAVGALDALLRDGDAAELLAAAEQRDRGRTAVLLASALALAGRGEHAASWLPQALGSLTAGTPVTRAQRALWVAAAAGAFGATGTAVLREPLPALIGGLTPDQERAEAEQWNRQVEELSTGVQPPQLLRNDSSVQRALTASERLAALRRMCCPDEATAPSVGEPDPHASDRSHLAPLEEVLQSLVDEGSTEEAPLLQRAAELRAIIEDGDAAAAPAAWHGDAGDPLDLVRADAFRRDSPALAEVARHAGRRWLVAAATTLVDDTAVDGPIEATIGHTGGSIRVRPTGADVGDLAAAPSRIRDSYKVDPRRRQVTIGFAVVGAVLCLAVIGWPNALAVLAVLTGLGLLIASGKRTYDDRRNHADQLTRQEQEITRVKRSADEAASTLADVERQLAERREQATADLSAIRTHLGV